MMTIRDILNELQIPFRESGAHHHVSHGWVGIDCPNCSPSTGKFRCGIHVRSLRVSCWVCGSQRLGSVLADASHQPLRHVLSLIESVAPGVIQDMKTVVRGKYTLPDGSGPLAQCHRDYLTKRHLDPDKLTQLYNLSGIGNEPDLKWRIVIPICTSDGKPVSWTTRAVGSAQPRYISASPHQESKPIKSLLFAEHLVRNVIIVTEGVFDAMRIGPGAVAVMGVSVTPVQVARIARYPIRVICFDSDLPGQSRAQKLVDSLGVFPGVTYHVKLDSPDPADASDDEILELRQRFDLPV